MSTDRSRSPRRIAVPIPPSWILLDPSMSALPHDHSSEFPPGFVVRRIPREVQPLFSTTLDHYDGFSGMGIPHISLIKVLQILWSEGCQIILTSVHSYEIDPDALRAASTIMPRPRLPNGTSYYGPYDVQSFPAHTKQHQLQLSTMISVFEMVPSAVRLWHYSLVHCFGSAILLKTGQGQATRDRQFYLVPTLSSCPPLTSPPEKAVQVFSDFSRWPATGESGSAPPTLRSIYPELLRRRAAGTAPQSDLITLDKFKVRTFDNCTRFSGPLHWCKWLGLDPSMTTKLMDAFPCSHTISITSGNWGAAHCGMETLCDNCSRLCAVIGRAWNIHEGIHIIETNLRQCIKSMHIQPRHILFYTAGSPCTRISRGIFCGCIDNQLVGPHAQPSNTMWCWHAGLVQHAQRLHRQFGSINHFTQQFFHTCSSQCPEAISLQQAKDLR